MDTKILIGADIVPTKSNYVEFIEGNVETLVGKTMCDLLHEMDFTIFNLEVPLTDVISPLQKCGPNLQALSKTINGIKKLNPYFFTLANNHILDQSVQGLKATMEILNRENIKYAGAGNDLKEASKPFVFEKNGINLIPCSCILQNSSFNCSFVFSFRAFFNPSFSFSVRNSIPAISVSSI